MSQLNTLSIDARMDAFLEVYRWQCTVSRECILSRRNMSLQSVHPFADAMTIVEVSDPNCWRVRLAGTAVCERLGWDATGRNAMAGLGSDEQALRRTLVDKLFADPCGIRAILEETYADGARNLVDTLSLPLIASDGARLIVIYAQIIEDINFEFRSRPRVVDSQIVSSRAVTIARSVEHRGSVRAMIA